jgi:hypothetical protein
MAITYSKSITPARVWGQSGYELSGEKAADAIARHERICSRRTHALGNGWSFVDEIVGAAKAASRSKNCGADIDTWTDSILRAL